MEKSSSQFALPINAGVGPTDKATRFAQKRARLEDAIALESNRLEKKRARAHFIVGEIVLDHPEVFALVSPHLDNHLAKLGSARGCVDAYAATREELARLRGILG